MIALQSTMKPISLEEAIKLHPNVVYVPMPLYPTIPPEEYRSIDLQKLHNCIDKVSKNDKVLYNSLPNLFTYHATLNNWGMYQRERFEYRVRQMKFKDRYVYDTYFNKVANLMSIYRAKKEELNGIVSEVALALGEFKEAVINTTAVR